MIGAIIGALILGAIVGLAGRAVLPGAQDIGMGKTVGLGVVANVIVALVFQSVNGIVAVILGALVAAGLLWFAIKQGWLSATSN